MCGKSIYAGWFPLTFILTRKQEYCVAIGIPDALTYARAQSTHSPARALRSVSHLVYSSRERAAVSSTDTQTHPVYPPQTVSTPEADGKHVLSCVKMYIQCVSWRICAFEDGGVLITEGASESSVSSDWSFIRASGLRETLTPGHGLHLGLG